MAYDYEGNLGVLRRMLREAEGYNSRYPQIWDLFENPEIKMKGLPIISASKDMDSPATLLTEIRREADGTFKFYDYFDDEVKESTPERIATQIKDGWGMLGPVYPDFLARYFCKAMRKLLKEVIFETEMENLEKKLLG